MVLKVINTVLAILAVVFYAHAQQSVLYAKDYLNAEDKDAVPGVLAMLKMAKERGINRVIFSKGTYHFYDARAFEKWCYISNHDSGMKKIAFPILNFNGLEIDGGGATFIMHGMIIPFVIENSSNITLCNFSIDWHRPTHSELKVVATDSIKRSIDFKIADEYPYEIRNGELIFIKKNFEHNLENAIFWNPQTNAVAFQAGLYRLNKNTRKALVNDNDKDDMLYGIDEYDAIYRYRGKDNELFASQIEPGLIRLENVRRKLPETGWVLVAKGRNGFNRMAPAIRLYATKDASIEAVNVHHASGMGLIAENCTNVSLKKFNVVPNPKNQRILTTTADATHFVGCRGKIVMDSCEFTNQLDDATNIHGTYVEVAEVDDNVVGVKIGYFQQTGFDFASPGDSIYIVNPKTNALPIGKLTLNSIEKINGRYYQLRFNEPLAEKLKKGYYLENMSAYPEAFITNSHFLNNRARGLLISTPRKVVIAGNTFSNMMSAIYCPNEFTFWYESGYFKDLLIMNNTFLDGSYGYATKPPALINIQAHSVDKDYIHGNVRIENNTFTTYAAPVLFAEFVKNVTFINNTIKYSGTYPIASNQPIIDGKKTFRADIINNRYDRRFKTFLSKEMKGKEHIIIRKNRVVTLENE